MAVAIAAAAAAATAAVIAATARISVAGSRIIVVVSSHADRRATLLDDYASPWVRQDFAQHQRMAKARYGLVFVTY